MKRTLDELREEINEVQTDLATPSPFLCSRSPSKSYAFHIGFSGNQDSQVLFPLYLHQSNGDRSHEIKRRLLLGRKVTTNLDSIFKSRDITLPTKVRLVKAMVFPVVMYGCESWCEESWVPKNWCFWTVVLGKTLESPLDCKEIQPVHPKGDHSCVFIGRTDAEAETPILWPLHAKSWLTGKDPNGGRDWGQEEKGMTEDEMAVWHHRLDGHEFEWTPGVGDGQGGLACCDLWGHRESDMTERLNWTEVNWGYIEDSNLVFY